LLIKKHIHKFLSDVARYSRGDSSANCTSDEENHVASRLGSPRFLGSRSSCFAIFCGVVVATGRYGSLSVRIFPYESIKPHAYHAIAVGLTPYRLSRSLVFMTTFADSTEVMLGIIHSYFERTFWKFIAGEIAIDCFGWGHSDASNKHELYA
jgi:hypothetical protein